ncbi:ABC transporter transmembrane domain-containing protein [Paenibacillus sp. HJGM_3]|uniref:ABC transporter transmembrane domain-containing protein n=1 Tax=Paenibacillus sp. HJGM_3 TaxID=3379816 RepID=UPI00385F3F82
MLWKSILAAVRSSPFFIFLILLGAVIDILFRYLSSLSYKYLIDLALLPRDGKALAIIIGVLLILGLFNVLIGISSDYAKARVGSGFLYEHRMRLFRHMQLQSQRFYDRFGVGDLMARYSEDIPAIQSAVLYILTGGFLSIASVVVGIAILFTMEWKLTLVTVAGSALLFIPFRLLKSRSLALGDVYYKYLDQFNRSVDENIKTFRVIRAFDLRSSMLAKIDGILHSMLSLGVQRNFVNSNLTRLPMLAISILTAAILAYGSYLTFDGSLTIGEFIAYNSIFFTVGTSMFGVTSVLPYILSARTSLDRLRQAMDWKPDVIERDGRELSPLRTDIVLRDVTFGYVPGEPVLQRLNLAIPVSGYTSIVGSSGAGKSTVLQLLLRFVDPQDGAVLFDGHDIRDARYATLLRQVGVVFQDSVMFQATIRDNILVGRPDASDAEIEDAARAAGIHDTIAAFRDGYDTLVRQYGDSLSGGQRQRIALARALLRNPRVLFLDEATSALDPDTERAVNETILALGRRMSIVSVTHRLAYAAMSDRIIVLDRGTVAETGTHEQLLQQDGLYRAMWEKQQGFLLAHGGDGAQVESNRLRQLPFFRSIDSGALDEISRLFVTEKFEAGATVVEQGDQGDKFYLIARGKVEVMIAAERGERRKVAVLEDGDHFGEIALMQHIPRTATIVTATPCWLLSLSYNHFHPLLLRYPAIREELEATLKSRMQRRDA